MLGCMAAAGYCFESALKRKKIIDGARRRRDQAAIYTAPA